MKNEFREEKRLDHFEEEMKNGVCVLFLTKQEM